jgi:hypothetical protein
MGRERRKYPRFETSWPVVITAAKRSLVGEVRNISLNGALIHCWELPSQKDSLDLEIEIFNHGYTVSTTAKVVHFLVEESDSSSPSYSFGVHFLYSSGKNRALLRNAVSSLSPKNTKPRAESQFTRVQ